MLMATNSFAMTTSSWRECLPLLTARTATLREPTAGDLSALFDLLSLPDGSRFGLEEPITELTLQAFVERARDDRAAGLNFTYVVTLGPTGEVVGLVQVRQLDPAFETAEWDITLAPSVRGTGVFVEAARLIGSFAFGSVGAYRLEARVLVQNGRANGAMRKLGAVQEGILRRSVRRGNEYLDQVLWSLLKEEWVDHWISSSPRVH
jgi:ribosomal-protein-alanine N-acetyltransferase